MWENRYNALIPERTDGNIRLYDGNQLRRLLNIVSLQKIGYKISILCTSDDDQLNNLMQENFIESSENDNQFAALRNQLIVAAATYNEETFNTYYDLCIEKYGILETYKNIIYPLLQQIGLLWSSSQLPVSQEHFITHLLQVKLYSALNSLPRSKQYTSTWLLFLPENEYHILGLLISSFLLQTNGHKVICLGSNTPFSILKEVINTVPVDNLLFFKVIHSNKEHAVEYIKELCSTFKKQKIYMAAGNELMQEVQHKSLHKLFSVKDLETIVK